MCEIYGIYSQSISHRDYTEPAIRQRLCLSVYVIRLIAIYACLFTSYLHQASCSSSSLISTSSKTSISSGSPKSSSSRCGKRGADKRGGPIRVRKASLLWTRGQAQDDWVLRNHIWCNVHFRSHRFSDSCYYPTLNLSRQNVAASPCLPTSSYHQLPLFSYLYGRWRPWSITKMDDCCVLVIEANLLWVDLKRLLVSWMFLAC